ncbi:MAG: riboflavin synthase subunit alpha [Armatimonadota bacterium]|nr:MAG: riboflavin synthase subunit alpha [Armatimonadota bacterium]
MFTGIIVDVGTVTSVRSAPYGVRLSVRATRDLSVRQSDSVSVNGVCLTATAVEGALLHFDCVRETLQRSTLRKAAPGDRVNLEPALKVGDPLGGHFVLGHVDATGLVGSVAAGPEDRTVTVKAARDFMRFIVEKGSVALDGISLTVAEVGEDWFSVKVVPYTWEATNLASRRPGDEVNLEADILGKYVFRLMQEGRSSAGVTLESLRKAGFA